MASDDEGVPREIRRKGRTIYEAKFRITTEKKLEKEGKNLTGWTHFKSYVPFSPPGSPLHSRHRSIKSKLDNGMS